MQQDDKEIKKLLRILNRKRDRKLKFDKPPEEPKKYIRFSRKNQKKIVAYSEPVYEFIKSFRLVRGKKYVSAATVFKVFKDWASKHKKARCSQEVFIKLMVLNFKMKTTWNGRRYFGLNEDISDKLPPEKVAEIEKKEI